MPTTSAFTPQATQTLKGASALALQKNNLFAGTEHLLVSLLTTSADTSSSVVHSFLEKTFPTHPVGALRALAISLIDSSTTVCEDASTSKKVRQLISPSLGRALEIAQHFVKTRATTTNKSSNNNVDDDDAAVAATNQGIDDLTLFLGVLSVSKADRCTTGVSVCCAKWLASNDNNNGDAAAAAADVLLEKVAEAAKVADVTKQLSTIPAKKIAEFGVEWCEPPIAVVKKQASSSLTMLPPDGSFASPIPNTHWVFPGKLLCGQSAGLMSQQSLKDMIEKLGVNVFCCLQTSYNEYGCNDYRQTIKGFASSVVSPTSESIRFLHCPIPDFGVTDDMSMVALVQQLASLIKQQPNDNNKKNNNFVGYIHCYGGHGRTGSVVANLINAVDPSSSSLNHAMRILQQRHMFRKECGGRCRLSCAQLEDQDQVKQVKRVTGAMTREKHLNK